MSNHVEKIQRQFERQGKAYTKLAYVSDEKGLDRVVAMGRVQRSDCVLDVACGPGLLTMAFARVCDSAVGVDATVSFLEGARAEAAARGVGNVEFREGVVEELPFDDDQFDVVVCRAAFHHFVDTGIVVAEMKRVCRVGGTLLIIDMVCSQDAEKAGYHNEMERLCDPTHVTCLTESEFAALFEVAGLRIEHVGRGGTSYSLTEWIGHGGPGPEDEATIRSMMEASFEEDKSGLKIWMEDDGLHFTHEGVGFVLKKI